MNECGCLTCFGRSSLSHTVNISILFTTRAQSSIVLAFPSFIHSADLLLIHPHSQCCIAPQTTTWPVVFCLACGIHRLRRRMVGTKQRHNTFHSIECIRTWNEKRERDGGRGGLLLWTIYQIGQTSRGIDWSDRVYSQGQNRLTDSSSSRNFKVGTKPRILFLCSAGKEDLKRSHWWIIQFNSL